MRNLIVVVALAACACGPASQAGVPEYGYDVVHVYPHDRNAFTEGLFYLNGFLYEGTGMTGQSSVRKVKLETGEVLQQIEIPEVYFGEGIIKWKDKLYEMTYKHEVGFIYDFATLKKTGEFHYPGQGWSFTTDGKQIYMDGSRDVNADASNPEIRILDPESLKEIGVIPVTDEGRPVENLNELEWVKGEIYANVWQTDQVVRIDPATGTVVGVIDFAGLLRPEDRAPDTDVLNGIAYDEANDRLYITGKCWPKLFEVRLKPVP